MSYNTGVLVVAMYYCCVKPTLNKLQIAKKKIGHFGCQVDQFLCFKLTMYLHISILDSRILQRKDVSDSTDKLDLQKGLRGVKHVFVVVKRNM